MELTKNKQQRVSDENKVCFGKKKKKTDVKFLLKSLQAGSDFKIKITMSIILCTFFYAFSLPS